MELIKRYDPHPNDTDWNDPGAEICSRRAAMQKKFPERIQLLNDFKKNSKRKLGSKIAHFTDNQFARYIDAFHGDVELAETSI